MPTWTYSYDPRGSSLDAVRFLIGDTDQTKAWTLYDGEIMYCVDQYPANIWLAAAVATESVVAKLKGTVSDKKVGDLSITYNANMLAAFVTLATTLRNRANMHAVLPWIGGVSHAEKQALYDDPDRVGTAVTVDGMDKVGPLSPTDIDVGV